MTTLQRLRPPQQNSATYCQRTADRQIGYEAGLPPVLRMLRLDIPTWSLGFPARQTLVSKILCETGGNRGYLSRKRTADADPKPRARRCY